MVDRWLFLAIPIVALIGAAQTAFDASYLIFSRQYATRLEHMLNRELGRDILIAHRLEEIRAADLALDISETSALVNAISEVALDQADAQTLRDLLEKLPAKVR